MVLFGVWQQEWKTVYFKIEKRIFVYRLIMACGWKIGKELSGKVANLFCHVLKYKYLTVCVNWLTNKDL